MKRILLVVLALVSTLGVAAPALAAPYPPGGPTVTTDKSSYSPGSTATLRATGFGACVGGVVTFTITPPGGGTPIVVTAPVQPDGTATTTVKLPTGTGTYTLVASCAGVASAATTFVISRLPVTGADTGSPLRIGAVLLLVGAGFVFVAVRRRRSPAAALA